MCLHNLHRNFSMEWNEKEKDFIGYGYKCYPSYRFNDNGKPNKKYCETARLSTRWQEASGSICSGGGTKAKVEYTDNGISYWPGFHIFLKEKDARDYYYTTVAKVMFKGLIGIGSNETGDSSNNSDRYGACVIARYMKFLEIVK